jgi:hypothetical protein
MKPCTCCLDAGRILPGTSVPKSFSRPIFLFPFLHARSFCHCRVTFIHSLFFSILILSLLKHSLCCSHAHSFSLLRSTLWSLPLSCPRRIRSRLVLLLWMRGEHVQRGLPRRSGKPKRFGSQRLLLVSWSGEPVRCHLGIITLHALHCPRLAIADILKKESLSLLHARHM